MKLSTPYDIGGIVYVYASDLETLGLADDARQMLKAKELPRIVMVHRDSLFHNRIKERLKAKAA